MADRRKYDSQLPESVGDHGQSLGVPGDLRLDLDLDGDGDGARARPAQSSVRTRLGPESRGDEGWTVCDARSWGPRVRIGVLSAGEGPPLLLVHGGVGQIERWDPVGTC